MQLAQFLPVYFETAKLWLFYFLTCQDNNNNNNKKLQDVIMFGFYCAAASFEVCGSVRSMWRHPLLFWATGVQAAWTLQPKPTWPRPPTQCGRRCAAQRDAVTAVLTCNGLQIHVCYNVMILFSFFFFIALLLKFFSFFFFLKTETTTFLLHSLLFVSRVSGIKHALLKQNMVVSSNPVNLHK